MATYPLLLRPSFSYEDHLMYNSYVADINKGIQRATSAVVQGQALAAQAISDSMQRNATQLSYNIQDLTSAMDYGLEQVSNGISGLRADFDIAMGQALSQFEMMREEMRTGFNRMIDILENRRKTEAQEHFRDALEFYRDGCRFIDKPQWFDDALRHLLASVEQYERNPLAHLHIGHIYHYQRKQRNFEKALQHYRLCYTYGEADEKDYPVAAQGYFYAGWLCAATFERLDEAISLTLKVLDLDPKFCEAHYHLAKFYAVRGDETTAMMHLEKAIVDFDSNYWKKAEKDPDFNKVHGVLDALFLKLKNQAKDDFEQKIAHVDRYFDPEDATWQCKLDYAWKRVDRIRKQGTFFAYQKGIEAVEDLAMLYQRAEEASREKIRFRRAQDYHKAVRRKRAFSKRTIRGRKA